MKMPLSALVLCLFTISYATIPPDVTADMIQMCANHGYKAEKHQVTTADGYILAMYHMSGYLNSTNSDDSQKPVVFMQHGLWDSSFTWIVDGAGLGPAYLMVDAGFDVWLGNNRGNYLSQNHTYLNRTEEAYWEFTWQHMAEYDIPAMIDYTLEQTNRQTLVYVGHSEGTTQMFARLADVSDFADKISLFIALAPAISTAHLDSKTIHEISQIKALSFILQGLGYYQFLGYPNMPITFYHICKNFSFICEDFLYFVADKDKEVDNIEQLPIVFSHFPMRTSLRNMVHWQQMTNAKEDGFVKYDYGVINNMRIYGQTTPPHIDVGKIKAKMAIFHGTDDRLADPQDVAYLLTQLPQENLVHVQNLTDFGH